MSHSPLAKCHAMRILNLSRCKTLTDLIPLQDCKSLEVLLLTNCDKLTKVSPLANCTALKMLNLTGTDNLIDVSSLANCKTLHTIKCSDDYVRQVFWHAGSLKKTGDAQQSQHLMEFTTTRFRRGYWMMTQNYA